MKQMTFTANKTEIWMETEVLFIIRKLETVTRHEGEYLYMWKNL